MCNLSLTLREIVPEGADEVAVAAVNRSLVVAARDNAHDHARKGQQSRKPTPLPDLLAELRLVGQLAPYPRPSTPLVVVVVLRVAHDELRVRLVRLVPRLRLPDEWRGEVVQSDHVPAERRRDEQRTEEVHQVAADRGEPAAVRRLQVRLEALVRACRGGVRDMCA